MLNLIKMQFKGDSFKRFNIIAISLTVAVIILSLIFKTQYFDNIYSIYSMSTLFLIIFFFNLENKNMNILMNSLPIKKTHIVFKNYIFLFVVFLLMNIYSYIYLFVLKNISSINMSYTSINEYLGSLSIVMIQLSLMLPILHFSSDVFSYIMVFIVLSFGGAIFRGYYEEITQMILNGKVYIIFLLALLIMAVSISISIFFYSNREFEGERG